MSKHFKCWCCEEITSPLFTKGFGTASEVKLCGSCIGTLAAIDTRLAQIAKSGKLSEHFTANTPDVPTSEKEQINFEE